MPGSRGYLTRRFRVVPQKALAQQNGDRMVTASSGRLPRHSQERPRGLLRVAGRFESGLRGRSRQNAKRVFALYKGEGFRKECRNYRPITHLSVPGKVFPHVMLARLQPLLTKNRRPEQSGFTAGRSTMDAILALRLLSEIHREFNRPLAVAYVDIKATFDSVDRKALC